MRLFRRVVCQTDQPIENRCGSSQLPRAGQHEPGKTFAFCERNKEQVVPVHPYDSNGIMLLPMAVAGVIIVALHAADGRPTRTGGLGGDSCPLR